MAISEDTATSSLTFVEKSAEILKALLQFLADNKQQKIGGNSKEKNASLKDGEVGFKKLKTYLEENNVTMKQQPGISKSDMRDIAKRAKEMGIPIAFTGKKNLDGANLVFAEPHKAVVENIVQDIIKERLARKPDDCLQFGVKKSEIAGIKMQAEAHGVFADFFKRGDGTYACVYQAKDKALMDVVKADYQAAHEKTAKNFECGYEQKQGKFVFKDVESGKTVSMNNFHTHAKIVSVLRDNFGYGELQAHEAANKFGSTLNENQRGIYMVDTRQKEVIASMNRSIKLDNESPLIRDYDFAQVNFKRDNLNRVNVTHGENTVTIIPSEMTRGEVEQAFRDKLGVTDTATLKELCDKTEAVNRQFKQYEKVDKSKTAERADKPENKGDFRIEKLDKNNFEVKQDDVQKRYNFADKKAVVAEIKKDFKVSGTKAERIFDKAKGQNALSNKLQKTKSAAAEKAKTTGEKAQTNDKLKNKKPTKSGRK